jgi:hypothetical protein
VEKKRQPLLNSLASKAPSCFLIAWIYEAFSGSQRAVQTGRKRLTDVADL